MIERDLEAVEDVPPRFCLAQLELGPPAHHLAAELDKGVDELDELQDFRPATDDRQHDDAEAGLELCVLVQVVEDDLSNLATLQVDDDAKPVAIRLVADVRDALDGFLAHELGNALDQPCLVDLIGNLVDDDRRAIAFLGNLDLRLRAHDDSAATGQICLLNPHSADDVAAGGEVGALDQLEELALLLGQRRR